MAWDLGCGCCSISPAQGFGEFRVWDLGFEVSGLGYSYSVLSS